MIDIKKIKEEQKDKHPGFSSYLECMTRTLFTGLAGFTLSNNYLTYFPLTSYNLTFVHFLGFSSVYFVQKLLHRSLPYNKKFFILTSAVAGSVVAFKITKDRTKTCQLAWMSAEDKLKVDDDVFPIK